LETNNYRLINFPSGEFYFDIAWTPDGKLYGVEGFTRKIMEINPYSGQTQFKADLTGYSGSNAMTSDASGNLYLATLAGLNWYIIKFNLSTGQITVIANLSASNLVSAGDLCFVNGFLYATCENNKLAKVDINTGAVQSFIVNGPFANGQGLTTLGDGYLYTSAIDKLYKIELATMNSTLFYTFPTYGNINGLTSYSEFCNAPGCRSTLNLSIESNTPYCSDSGVLLKGVGRGITVPSTYTWTLPNGQTKNGDSLIAFISGTYKLRYHTVPDTCGSEKSITLNITKHPAASLGKDTILCAGTNQILLLPSNTQDVTHYLWQDGSIDSQFVARQPGTYWLKTSNVCGSGTDTIQVIAGSLPEVELGGNVLLCPGSFVHLSNQFPLQPGENYLWSTNQFVDSIKIFQSGVYWLEATNGCGKTRDSTIVLPKDSCICNPVFPEVNFGSDKELCENESEHLVNILDDIRFSYTWQDGSHQRVYIVRQPGTYWVEVSTNCGILRDTILVKRKEEGCICSAYFPTAFTPDADSKNDLFKPLSNCALSGQLNIYNRWGILVYTTSDLQKGWGGLYKGEEQPTGVYVYQIRYKFLNGRSEFYKKGTFILLR
jgi:gliding motility-associated-like protein